MQIVLTVQSETFPEAFVLKDSPRSLSQTLKDLMEPDSGIAWIEVATLEKVSPKLSFQYNSLFYREDGVWLRDIFGPISIYKLAS